ncbi:MAG: PAS domain-containing sensor histidine kinase [Ignavibacteriae bacterium]|nr:PAS domain-containing sensor histidine kinase [Ignavibacteriota bacterium]
MSSVKQELKEERSKRLLKFLTDYIYNVLIENGEVIETFHGPGCYAVTGYKSSDYMKDPELWYNMVHDEDKHKVLEQSQKALKGENVLPLEHRIIHRDGSTRWVKNSIVLQKDEKGNVISYDGIVNDITKLKESEEQNKIKSEQLIHADKMASLGILVSGIAHEINNPNNFIMLNINLLKKIWEDVKPILNQYYIENGDFALGGMSYKNFVEKIDKSYDSILSGSERIKKIIDNLTNYAKYPSMEYKKISINEVVDVAVSITNNFISKSTNNFTINYSKGFPLVWGSANRLEQVVINLINNACQSLTNKDQKIIINVYEEFNKVIIEVIDEGEGIGEKDLKYIFDPFYTTKREKGGTGLGLSITYNIIKNHNGEFKIESRKGKGTKVKIYFPIYLSAEGEKL